MIIAATGHRRGPEAEFTEIAKAWLSARRPAGVISGMALGWDQAVAAAAIDLGIPVHAYIPFPGQSDLWPPDVIYRYGRLINACETRRFVNFGPYEPWKMQARNEAMVDACDFVLAMWSGKEGGTANCVRYAGKVGKPVENLWEIYDTEL